MLTLRELDQVFLTGEEDFYIYKKRILSLRIWRKI